MAGYDLQHRDRLAATLEFGRRVQNDKRAEAAQKALEEHRAFLEKNSAIMTAIADSNHKAAEIKRQNDLHTQYQKALTAEFLAEDSAYFNLHLHKLDPSTPDFANDIIDLQNRYPNVLAHDGNAEMKKQVADLQKRHDEWAKFVNAGNPPGSPILIKTDANGVPLKDARGFTVPALEAMRERAQQYAKKNDPSYIPNEVNKALAKGHIDQAGANALLALKPDQYAHADAQLAKAAGHSLNQRNIEERQKRRNLEKAIAENDALLSDHQITRKSLDKLMALPDGESYDAGKKGFQKVTPQIKKAAQDKRDEMKAVDQKIASDLAANRAELTAHQKTYPTIDKPYQPEPAPSLPAATPPAPPVAPAVPPAQTSSASGAPIPTTVLPGTPDSGAVAPPAVAPVVSTAPAPSDALPQPPDHIMEWARKTIDDGADPQAVADHMKTLGYDNGNIRD